jgi:hypothetical protein
MINAEIIDTQVDDLRDRLPLLLRQNPRAIAFLQAFSDRAGAIIETAAILGDAEAAYARQRVAEVLIAFGRETGLTRGAPPSDS